MRSWLARAVLAAASAALGGCASDPVPDVAYHQLPAFKIATRAAPAVDLPIEVEAFRADGVYNEQPVLYASEDQGSLRGYHYQLWSDPPTRLLQRRLIETLRKGNFAPLVADRLSPSVEALHLSALIQHFERIKADAGWRIRVQLEFRVERSENAVPVLLKQYGVDELVADQGMPATVAAFGHAVDQCFAQLLGDLEQVRFEPTRPEQGGQ
jgi:ABC-type uncharacterized transport system auxiliary subunit